MVLVANPSADLYGSDRMMLETVRGLREEGWQVVVSASTTGPLRDQILATGAQMTVCSTPVVRKSSMSPTGLARLLLDCVRGLWPMVRTIRRWRPDALYVSTVTIPLWLVIGRLLRVPTVIHVHEAEASAHALARVGLSLPAHLARRVIFNSETSRGVAGAVTGPARRIRVIHNGVTGPPAVRPPRAEIDCLELVYVGRLSPRKGVDVAVAALAEVSKRGIDARLSLVGSVFPGYEWYEEQLCAQAEELGLTQRLTFHGFQDDVWPYFAASDIVLVPSRADESFGNSVIEAALSARPVVVSDHTGLREAAEALTAAVRVPADDVAAVADAVEALLGDWPQTRLNATRDATWAAAVYAPERYRRLVCRVIGDAADRQR